MPSIEKAVKYMEDIANDNSHGYAQDHRNGDPDYDCSSLVGTALNVAGFNVSKGSTTRNLYQQLINCGFKELQIDAPRKRGDIFLSVGHHVVMCTDADNIVHASLNENGGIKNGQPGDQTGKEICIRSYYNHKNGWTYHLRYEEKNPCAFLVDLSKYNVVTDYSQLAKEVDGVILRAGYRGSQTGVITIDPRFESHISELIKRNVKVGLYFYTQAVNEAEGIQEAQWIVGQAKKYKIDYPIFIDSEYSSNHNGRADNLDKNTRTKIMAAFCNEVAKSGYTAGVYASDNWFKTQLNFNEISNWFIWCARYSTVAPTISKYDAWQYGSQYFSWASGAIDVNHWYTSIVPTPVPTPTPTVIKNVVKVNTSLNVRNKPVNGTVVGKLYNGDEVAVIGYQKGWLKIGNDQWVSELYVASPHGIVTTNSLNVRKGYSTAYESIGFVHKNNNVKITKEMNGWYQIISSDGLFGWASGKYIDII